MQTLARRFSILVPTLTVALAVLWWWSSSDSVSVTADQSAKPEQPLAASTLKASANAGQQAARLAVAGLPPAAQAGSSSGMLTPAAISQASYQEARRALHERDLYRSYVKLHDARVPGSSYAARILVTACVSGWLDAQLPVPGDAPGTVRVLEPLAGEDATLRSRRLAAQQEIRTRCESLIDDGSRQSIREDDPYAPQLGERAERMSRWDKYAHAVHSGDAVMVLGMLREPKGAEPFFEGQRFGGARQEVFNRALDLALLRFAWDPQASSPAMGSLALCARSGRCGLDLEQELGGGAPSFSDPAVRELAQRLRAAIDRGDTEAFLKGNVKDRKP